METEQHKRTLFFLASGKNAAHLNEEGACVDGYDMEAAGFCRGHRLLYPFK